MDKDQELLDPFQDDLDISEVLDDSEDEIYDSEDDPEASEEDETEEYEEDEEDDSDLNDKKAKRIRAIHIAVVVLGVLIVCEYTFFGVFFHNNKKKYEKAQKAASVTEAEAEEDTEENVVTEAPLPTTNVMMTGQARQLRQRQRIEHMSLRPPQQRAREQRIRLRLLRQHQQQKK